MEWGGSIGSPKAVGQKSSPVVSGIGPRWFLILRHDGEPPITPSMHVGKKIVVIPDIHEASNLDRVEAAIGREKPDLTVFLGDFFDQWDDTPRDAGRTAEWLAHSVEKPNRIHLFGNHDLPYAYPECRALKCPGWTTEKQEAVKIHLPEMAWASLKLAHWEGDLLFTHAGWSRNCTPVDSELFKDPKAFLDDQISSAWAKIPDGGFHWVFLAGRGRGGANPCGGLTWCDLREFRTIPGVNQVFGHTPGNLGPIPNEYGVENWVCDTTDRRQGVRNYLLVANNSITAHRLDGIPVQRKGGTALDFRQSVASGAGSKR